jgi:hypothetical protein
MMLPAILKFHIPGFGSADEKVYYELFRESKLKTEQGTEWFFNLKNNAGNTIVVAADESIFRMYRVK